MRKRIFMAVTALMALAACSDKNITGEPMAETVVKTPITITATYGGDDATRVEYTESGNSISATWQSGDEILVIFDGHVNTLTLTSGTGTSTATFCGTIQGTPLENSLLSCYVRDANNPEALTISNGNIIYSSAAFQAQDGTVAGAAKCNTYSGSTTYGDGTNLSVAFGVNTSILKFTVLAPNDVTTGTTGVTLTYNSGETALAKATFTVGTNGVNTVYMAVPAGQYSGEQTLVYKSGATEVSRTLSTTKANFTPGQTYSKEVIFDNATHLDKMTTDYTATNGEILTGKLGSDVKISIADGATVTLRGVTIDGKDFDEFFCDWAGITCLGDATIILAEGSTNSVKGFRHDNPGIFVPKDKTLTIRGTGSLNVSAHDGGAGIGSGNYKDGGNIVIKGGNITANGGDDCPGIGGGNNYGSCGTITITGGTVNATGGDGGAGIGSGTNGTCGKITITGGTVNATGGRFAAGIGSGYSYQSRCNDIIITTGVICVTATKGEDALYSIGSGSDASCGTITIGCTLDSEGNPVDGTNYGTVGINTSPFTYPVTE